MGMLTEVTQTVSNLVGGIINATDNIACIGMLYDAWGNVTYDYNKELDSLGMLEAMIVASMNSIAYRGYFYDFETVLYYLQSRYYDPETGRFINADDTAYIGYDGSPISTNIFAYCANNPVNFVDYSGNKKTPLQVLRQKAQKEVLNAMRDDYAKIIVSHWFYGEGRTLETGRTRTDWSIYMTKNTNLKNVIIKYARSALKNKKSTFYFKNISLSLSANGNGGYFTGYDLLNGSNKKYGGFCAEGSLRKTGKNKYNVSFTFTFNDYVDPNYEYRSDKYWEKIMKKVVLYKGQGINYIIRVSGGGMYQINY